MGALQIEEIDDVEKAMQEDPRYAVAVLCEQSNGLTDELVVKMARVSEPRNCLPGRAAQNGDGCWVESHPKP